MKELLKEAVEKVSRDVQQNLCDKFNEALDTACDEAQNILTKFLKKQKNMYMTQPMKDTKYSIVEKQILFYSGIKDKPLMIRDIMINPVINTEEKEIIIFISEYDKIIGKVYTRPIILNLENGMSIDKLIEYSQEDNSEGVMFVTERITEF